MTESIHIKVRAATDRDMPFVFSTWLKSILHSTKAGRETDEAIFARRERPLLGVIVSRPGTRVLIAHPPGDDFTIVGYLVYEETTELPAIHFAYTKQPLREFGVMRALLASADLDPDRATFTYWTSMVNRLIYRWPHAKYQPLKP